MPTWASSKLEILMKKLKNFSQLDYFRDPCLEKKDGVFATIARYTCISLAYCFLPLKSEQSIKSSNPDLTPLSFSKFLCEICNWISSSIHWYVWMFVLPEIGNSNYLRKNYDPSIFIVSGGLCPEAGHNRLWWTGRRIFCVSIV